MATWLFFYAFLGIAPLVQLRDEVDPGTTLNVDHAYDQTAIWIVITAEVMLIIGSFAAKRADLRQRLASARDPHPQRSSLAVLAILSLAVAYIALIGPATLVLPRNQRSAAVIGMFSDPVVGAIVSGFVSLGLLTAIVASLEVQRRRRAAGERVRHALIMVAIVVVIAIVNPVGSSRYATLTVVLALAAAFGAYAKIGRYRFVSIAALVAMFLLFPILGVIRSTLGGSVSLDPLASLTSGDFDAYAQIVNTAQFVDENGITWGRQFLGVLLFWVPRSMWAGKPVDTGILLADFKGYWFTNLSAPLPAEFFINGGWVVLVIGSFVVGYLLRVADARSERQIQAMGVPTILGCVLPFYLILILRGSLLQATATLAVIVATWYWSTRRPRREESVGDTVASNLNH